MEWLRDLLDLVESFVDWKVIGWLKGRIPRAQRVSTKVRRFQRQERAEQDQRAETAAAIAGQVGEMQTLVRSLRSQVSQLQSDVQEHANLAATAQRRASQAEERGDQEEAERQRLAEQKEMINVEGLSLSLDTAETTLGQAEAGLKQAKENEIAAIQSVQVAEVKRFRNAITDQMAIMRASMLDLTTSMQERQRALLDLAPTHASAEAGRASLEKELKKDEALVTGRSRVYTALAEARGQSLVEGLRTSATSRSREIVQRALEKAGHTETRVETGTQEGTETRSFKTEQ